jgi:hypothetical protein
MLMANYASSGILYPFYKGYIMRIRRKDQIDEIGNVYNDLTVISYAEKGKYRGARWLCRCVCGNECVVPGGHLRANMRQSCGCRSQRRIKDSGARSVYLTYRARARSRKIPFNLTMQEFTELIFNNCNYCGREPFNELKRSKTKKLQIKYNGIDRVIHKGSYSKDNCVTCCYYCNHAKLDLSIEQFKEQIGRVYHYLFGGITDGTR